MMQIPLEQAYALACQKIGEGQIREEILRAEIIQKDQIIALFQSRVEAEVAKSVIEEATGIVQEAPNANDGDGSRVGPNGSVPDPTAEG